MWYETHTVYGKQSGRVHLLWSFVVEIGWIRQTLIGLSYSNNCGRFFGPCDLEICQMTLKNYKEPLPCSYKLYVPFHIHPWIQSSTHAQIGANSSTLRSVWPQTRPRKTIGNLVHAPRRYLCLFTAIHEFNLEVSFRNPQIGANHRCVFDPCDLEIWWMTTKNNRAPLLCHFKLCASFRIRLWIQIVATVRKCPNGGYYLDIGELDRWPWSFAWSSHLSMVISPKISWWYDDRNIVKRCDKGTDRQTDKRTERTVHGTAWSQLKWWL